MNQAARTFQVVTPSCRALIAAALLFLSAALGGAEERVPRPAKVLVLVRSSNPVDNPALSSLIQDSISMELQARNIDVLPSADMAAGDTDLEALRDQAKADFVLSGAYEMTGSAIRIDVKWIDLADLREAGNASRNGELNLTFDALVAGLVDELVEGQKEAIASLPPEAPAVEPPPPGQPQPVTPPGAAVQPETVPTPAPAATPTPAVTPAPAAGTVGPALQVAEAAAKQPRLAPLAFSVGSAPFIATFTAMNYFPLGISLSLNGRYQVRALGGLLGLGFLSGFSGFHGRGEYAQADFYVVPIGPEILYGTLTGGRIDFFVHLSAGPAVLIAKPSFGGLLAKVIPFALGGVGLTWSVFDALAVSLDAGYTSFFDSSAAIMGFTPSLSAVLKL